MPTDRVEFLDYGEELTPSTKTCPKCDSNKKRFHKFVNETLRFREGTLTTGDGDGQIN